MNFLKGTWKWTKEHLDWVAIGANTVIVAVIIYYTFQMSVTTTKYEIQNLQLLGENIQLNEQNEALGGVLNSAIKSHNLQQDVIEKQKEIIKQLIERNKFLEAYLNGDIT